MRSLIADGWWPDEEGRALLLDDGEQLISWRTLALGGPHHADVMRALDVAVERVAAYLTIAPNGELTVTNANGSDEQTLAERACALDARLRPPSARWRF